MQTFDPDQEFFVTERRLPHWSQPGTIAFITWRTWDSMPEGVLRDWRDERDAWLRCHRIDPASLHWKTELEKLAPIVTQEFHRLLSDRWNDHLDACHGACVLRTTELAKLVGDSLLHFDDDRYDLTDFVVMPNHVHLLAAFPDEKAMLEQCESWKHFTAARINKILGRSGRFWQQDGFDHLVRTSEQYAYLRVYLGDNPKRAKLKVGEFLHYSKRM